MAPCPVLPDFIPRSVGTRGERGDQGEACAGVGLASVAQVGPKEEGGEVGRGEHLYAPPCCLTMGLKAFGVVGDLKA